MDICITNTPEKQEAPSERDPANLESTHPKSTRRSSGYFRPADSDSSCRRTSTRDKRVCSFNSEDSDVLHATTPKNLQVGQLQRPSTHFRNGKKEIPGSGKETRMTAEKAAIRDITSPAILSSYQARSLRKRICRVEPTRTHLHEDKACNEWSEHFASKECAAAPPSAPLAQGKVSIHGHIYQGDHGYSKDASGLSTISAQDNPMVPAEDLNWAADNAHGQNLLRHPSSSLRTESDPLVSQNLHVDLKSTKLLTPEWPQFSEHKAIEITNIGPSSCNRANSVAGAITISQGNAFQSDGFHNAQSTRNPPQDWTPTAVDIKKSKAISCSRADLTHLKPKSVTAGKKLAPRNEYDEEPSQQRMFGKTESDGASDADNVTSVDSIADVGHNPRSSEIPAHLSSSLQTTPTRRKTTANLSPFFEPERCNVKSCLVFPRSTATCFGLIQERLAHDPFKLLVAVIFLHQTKGSCAVPVLLAFLKVFRTADILSTAEPENIEPFIRSLGLQRKRAQLLVSLARSWLASPPLQGRRYRFLNYPSPGAGADIALGEQPIGEDDTREAWEIAHLPGVGPYALDSWRIFCCDALRGTPRGSRPTAAITAEDITREMSQEWTNVLPTDKELKAYVQWRWIRLGWLWDSETGAKHRVDPSILQSMEEGSLSSHRGYSSPWSVGLGPPLSIEQALGGYHSDSESEC